LFLQQPARIVFAETGRLNERSGFVRVGVGCERRFWRRKHQILEKWRQESNTLTQEGRKALPRCSTRHGLERKTGSAVTMPTFERAARNEVENDSNYCSSSNRPFAYS